MHSCDIDFVITWVDMDDPEWKRTFAKYSGKVESGSNPVSDARFRDYGLLRYWFRGVEKFTPWVRKIHFVTCGQKPEWLDEDNPKIHLVNHTDYIPQEYLPCFNSTVLESFMHRIPGLAERFVYFNDDCHLISPTPVERFFRGGLPCDIAAFRLNTSMSLWAKTLRNNLRLINSKFDKREVLRRDREKWLCPKYGSKSRMTRLLWPCRKFITLRVPHNAQPYLKSTFQEVWDEFGPQLGEAATHRFRCAADLTPELFRTWQICMGNFEAYNTYCDTRMFPLVLKSAKAIRAVREQKYRLVCLNDNAHIRNYDKVMSDLKEAFESILPDKSSFEK